MKVEFSRARQGSLQNLFQVIHIYLAVPNQKNEIVQVAVTAAIQFAESDAVRIHNIYVYFPILTYMNFALLVSFRQWNKMLDGNSLRIQAQFIGNFLDGNLKFVFVDIITHIINIERFACTSEEYQRAASKQIERRLLGITVSQLLKEFSNILLGHLLHLNFSMYLIRRSALCWYVSSQLMICPLKV